MALLHKGPEGHVFEALAHIWQWPSILHHWLVLVDYRQGNAEEDFRTLVEETIPYPEHCLQEGLTSCLIFVLLFFVSWCIVGTGGDRCACVCACVFLTSTGNTSMKRQMNQRETTSDHMTPCSVITPQTPGTLSLTSSPSTSWSVFRPSMDGL